VKRAALDNARAQLAKLQAQPRPEELPPLEEKVSESKALLADAEVQVKLIEGVADPRAVKKEDVLRRQQNYNAAKARLAQAEKDLAKIWEVAAIVDCRHSSSGFSRAVGRLVATVAISISEARHAPVRIQDVGDGLFVLGPDSIGALQQNR
jgi:hypothetical protein